MPSRTHVVVSLTVPVLLLLLFVPLGWAQAAPQAQLAPTPEPTEGPPIDYAADPVTFSGIVLGPSQTGLPGVSLSAFSLDPNYSGYDSTTTDGTGQFVLHLTPRVPYRVMLCYSVVCYYYHPDGLKPQPGDGALITLEISGDLSNQVIQWLEPVTFSGTVTGADGQGIKNINITAEALVQGQPIPYTSTQTQDGGYYSLTVPARQVYHLYAEPGLPDQPYKRVYYQNVTDRAQAVFFDTSWPGMTFPGIDFQLVEAPSFFVSGVIRDEHQQPLQGAWIDIQNLTHPDEYPTSLSSDAQGHYRVRLDPGTSYRFQFYSTDYPRVFYNNSGGSPVSDLAETISGADGEERTLDYQFLAPVTFSGKVTGPAGDALEGVQVIVYEKISGRPVNNSPTRPDGTFRITAPAGSDYSLSTGPVDGPVPLQEEYYLNQTSLDLATFVTGAPGAQYANLNFVLDPVQVLKLAGNVTGPDGSPLRHVSVQVLRGNGSSTITQINTDENGEYQVSLPLGERPFYLFPGEEITLTACAQCAGYPYGTLYYTAAGGLPFSSLAEKITSVGGQTRSGLDIHFRQPITFSGWVKDTQGNPLQGVWVGVEEAETRQSIASGVTGGDGRYTLQAPPGMRMRLSAWPDSRTQPLRGEYYDNQTNWESAHLFGGQTPGAIYADRNFTLEPKPVTYVSGVVRGPDGRPLSGVTINGISSPFYASYAQAATGADGRYRLALDPGKPYRILASASCGHSPCGTLYYHPSGNTPIYENAQILTGVDSQERDGIDFQFADPVVISGRVTGPDGSPLANAAVRAEDAAAAAYLGETSTDAQGRYSLYIEPGYPLRLSVTPYYNGPDAKLASVYYPRQYNPAQARVFEGAPGEHFESIDFQLEAAVAITGRVSNQNGTWQNGVEVQCEQEGLNAYCGHTYTDTRGQYTLYVPPERPLRISAGGQERNGLIYSRVYANGTPLWSKAERLSGKPGETLHVDFQIVPAVSVSGHVYAPDGSPLKAVNVTVLGETDQDRLGTATTEADGSYTAYIHPVSAYTVKVDPGRHPYPAEYYHDAPNRAQAANLTGDHNRQGIDFTLDPPAVLRGQVTLPDGRPLLFPNVTALDANSGEVLSYSHNQEDGTYTMYLRSGHLYHIQVLPYPYESDFLVEYWDNRHARAMASAVQMSAPGTERILNLQVDPFAAATQSLVVGQPFTYTLPDAGPDLTFSAGLANGQGLPGWLRFNPATRTFSGAPTAAALGRLNIRVTVLYDGGRQWTRTFIIHVAPTPSLFLPVVRK